MTVVWWDEDDQSENHCRRTFCQIPFTSIYDQAEKGKRSLHRLVDFFRHKADAERSASEFLGTLLRQTQQPPAFLGGTTYVPPHRLEELEEQGTSIRRALMEVQHYVEATCTQQLLLAKVLEEQVAEPLASLQTASDMYIQTLQEEIRVVNDDYTQASQALQFASARLRKAETDLKDAQDRQRMALHGIGIPAFELQRLASRVAKCTQERDQAQQAKAQTKQTLYHRIISRDEMAMAVSVAYQKAEEERLDQLNSCLQRFLHVEQERIKVAQAMLEQLEVHINSVNRSEDIQLLIHNRRNPDNMHFQGKALALLDWHWNKMHGKADGEMTHTQRQSHKRKQELIDSDEDEATVVSTSRKTSMERLQTPKTPQSPFRVLAQTPMGKAIREFFDPEHHALTLSMPALSLSSEAPAPAVEITSQEPVNTVPPAVANHEEATSQEPIDSDTTNETDPETSIVPQPIDSTTSSESIEPKPADPSSLYLDECCVTIKSLCKDHDGRAMFVKCLNRQRSLDTKLKDRQRFDALVECFNVFLDECMREDDIKAAKTAMILAETFYYPRDRSDESTPPPSSGGLMGRGATRMYLQEHVKKHAIWKNPSFWEKALLLAIGEELQKTPQPCAWEDLPTRASFQPTNSTTTSVNAGEDPQAQLVDGHHGGTLPTREEAVCRVHNIVFGQLGSFTLSMLEFDVSLAQIQSFIETMCDAHELTEDQRYLLRKNLQEIYTTLR